MKLLGLFQADHLACYLPEVIVTLGTVNDLCHEMRDFMGDSVFEEVVSVFKKEDGVQ